MAKLGPINFDDCILDALKSGNLVVFAGAGVSMGPPSNLASFERLANDIARGTGLTASMPLDRFLGQLKHSGVAVHERAVQLLSPVGSEPNEIHFNLLRLFGTIESVRIVTTNFDQHFEAAAQQLFGRQPDNYRAPALPLGDRFSGIVHVHGIVTHPSDLVLTDADFGRAYLTEGWARRFLVDVFRKYTVLFVGYSHTDVVMNYLARALPAQGIAGRFALTEEDGSWELLGIKPIKFNKGVGVVAYQELYEGIQALAVRSARGVLDWQTQLMEIGANPPPFDEEAVGEVEQALREVYTTRFLLNAARDRAWLAWLNARKYLDALFSHADLVERDDLLVRWIAENFSNEHPEAVFELFVGRKLQINRTFWLSLCRAVGLSKDKPLTEQQLTKWVSILLATAPSPADTHSLMWLVERCSAQGATLPALKAFLHMAKHAFELKLSFSWGDPEDKDESHRLTANCSLSADHWALREVWESAVRPNLASISQLLLAGIAEQFEKMYEELQAWGSASRTWDPVGYGRSAIEPHEQDSHPEAVDVLIDAARESLEWLATNSLPIFEAWIEILIASDMPLLRRLGLHAVIVHPSWSADERLRMLLQRMNLHDVPIHHEVFRALELSYGEASEEVRRSIVDAVLAHEVAEFEGWSAEKCTARSHFDWLSWLVQAKPDCELAQAALSPIQTQYPEWLPSDHPDLTHWSGVTDWSGPQSPWSVEQILSSGAENQLESFLTYKGSHFEGPSREGLIGSIREACKQNPDWGFTLLSALESRSIWESDLWPAALHGLREADLTLAQWRALLSVAEGPELLLTYKSDITRLLYALVKEGGKPFAADVLEQANAVSLSAWGALAGEQLEASRSGWLSLAINRPAGRIVEFWLGGLSILMHGRTGTDRHLPERYRDWLTAIVDDPTSRGGLGRAVLASQVGFLSGLDEAWTREHIIPLFSSADGQCFAQAWDGFLTWGRLSPKLSEELIPAFIAAVPRIGVELPERRHRFMEFYAALAVFQVSDPTQSLLPPLFQNGSPEDWSDFSHQIGYILSRVQPDAKRRLWDSWLSRYWGDRLQAVPTALVDAEVRAMLDWLLHFDDLFPAAVGLAARSPTIQIEHSSLVYRLRESDLVTRFPAEAAELLIYLCKCDIGYQIADLAVVAARLPVLEPGLKRRLDEALAQAGAFVSG